MRNTSLQCHLCPGLAFIWYGCLSGSQTAGNVTGKSLRVSKTITEAFFEFFLTGVPDIQIKLR